MSDIFPLCVVEYSSDPLPRGPTVEAFVTQLMMLVTFGSERSFERYLSNIPKERHTILALLKEGPSEATLDHFAIIDRLLTRARDDMPPEDFAAGMRKLGQKYFPSVDTVSKSLGTITVTSRDSSANKRRATAETNDRSHPSAPQRQALVLAEERQAAQTNFTYAYPMNVDKVP